MQQEDDFNFWLDECRNYGLRVTNDRLIKSLYEFDDFAYQSGDSGLHLQTYEFLIPEHLKAPRIRNDEALA